MIINFLFGWSKSSDIFNANGGSTQPEDVDRRQHNGNTGPTPDFNMLIV